MQHIQSEKIGNEIYLHTIKEDKFKTHLINIYLQRPLNEEEVTYNALIPKVLLRGTEKLTSSQEIAKKLEELYGAYLNGDVTKKGERQMIQFSLMMADEKFIQESSVIEKAISLLNDVMYAPYKEKEGFSPSFVEQEKLNVEERIKGRINDKMKYAVDRCIEEMCSEESYRLYEHGRIEDLEGINPQNLYEHYNKVMTTSPMDIVVVGNMEHEKIRAMLIDNLRWNREEIINLGDGNQGFTPTEVKNIVEEMDVNQGKLSLGYRTNIAHNDPAYYSLMVYSSILGGGAHSKLFLKVREEKSLCYYIFSRLEKFKSLMLISSGIEVAQYEEALTVIKAQLEAMKKGEITQEEMQNSKKAIITSIRGLGDSAGSLADYYFSQRISNGGETLEQIIEKIEKVTVEDVKSVAQNITLDTIYFLKNRG